MIMLDGMYRLFSTITLFLLIVGCFRWAVVDVIKMEASNSHLDSDNPVPVSLSLEEVQDHLSKKL